jgi:hypothetical protein
VLATLACSAVTGGGGSQPQATPAQPDQGQPVQPDQGQPVNPGRQVLFQDDFSNTSSGWPAASDAQKTAGYSADGKYAITVVDVNQDVWAHPGQTFSDVSVEVDATKTSGPDNNGFGVVCRFQDNDNFYYFMVSSDGYQVIGMYQGGDKKYLSAEKMQPTDALTAGDATNHVRGDCVGSTLTLYANGQQLSSVTDTSFASGDIGLIVGTFDEPNVAVAFDNFVVYQP